MRRRRLGPSAIREVRVLNEPANDGDTRRLVGLLSLSTLVNTRYTASVGHPDLAGANKYQAAH
ncbi:hypothetical protein [Micromonospora echinofusca]|uniref:hypothetical protein n=1 Tax=Micromonospora echinofusca TaxID=47858 RepID=UPI0037190600